MPHTLVRQVGLLGGSEHLTAGLPRCSPQVVLRGDRVSAWRSNSPADHARCPSRGRRHPFVCHQPEYYYYYHKRNLGSLLHEGAGHVKQKVQDHEQKGQPPKGIAHTGPPHGHRYGANAEHQEKGKPHYARIEYLFQKTVVG